MARRKDATSLKQPARDPNESQSKSQQEESTKEVSERIYICTNSTANTLDCSFLLLPLTIQCFSKTESGLLQVEYRHSNLYKEFRQYGGFILATMACTGTVCAYQQDDEYKTLKTVGWMLMAVVALVMHEFRPRQVSLGY